MLLGQQQDYNHSLLQSEYNSVVDSVLQKQHVTVILLKLYDFKKVQYVRIVHVLNL